MGRIIRKVWPKSKYIDVIATGSMAQYLPSLEFYCGGIPIVSMPYASSESFLGINLKPLSKPSDVSYTLVPNVSYFEFLPVMDHEQVTKEAHSNTSNESLTQKQIKEEEIEPVELVNVKLGQCYELVVTTVTGKLFFLFIFKLRVWVFYSLSHKRNRLKDSTNFVMPYTYLTCLLYSFILQFSYFKIQLQKITLLRILT